ncbi:hypothetical protein AMTR_s00194p00013510 [Amborella trichopoda]|uniref:Uncharacterized protein n=1 Tax=Amborella trichopoda TaxID=13333 RepID=U5D913_AMBTC|nr:hypothetical protein AMTR_s00194p00013510 [Amborella trichopoda]
MSAQRMTIMEGKQHEILLEGAQALPYLPPGMLKKTMCEWETQINCGRLSLKCPSQAATPEISLGNFVFSGEIVVVEVCIPVEELNWNKAQKSRRPRRSKVQILVEEFPYDPLTHSPSRVTRGGAEFHMYR